MGQVPEAGVVNCPTEVLGNKLESPLEDQQVLLTLTSASGQLFKLAFFKFMWVASPSLLLTEQSNPQALVLCVC